MSFITSVTTDLISVIIAGIALFISMRTYHDKQFSTAKEYLDEFSTTAFLAARQHVYTTPPDEMDLTDEKASMVINFFHGWGLLAKRHYLPKWVLKENASTIVRLYTRLKPHIDKKRERFSGIAKSSLSGAAGGEPSGYAELPDEYASGFEWLYNWAIRYSLRKNRLNQSMLHCTRELASSHPVTLPKN